MSEIKQGYKQTKVGILPQDWEVKYIEDIAEVKGGKRLPLGHELTETITPYPYIRVTNMSMGGLNDRQILYVPIEVQPKIKNYTISENDLYIAVAGNTLGMVGTIPAKFDGANLTENADKICNIKMNKEFLLFVLMSDLIQNVIQNEITTNAQPKLALTRIKKFHIPLPPLKEQEKIAEILTTWDEAIRNVELLILNYELRKKALMQKLLSGEVRFDGFSDEWEEVRLDKLFDFKKGQELSKEKLEENGIFECILYGELYTTYSEVIKEIKSKTNIEEGIKSKIDDILIPASTTTSAIDLAIASTVKKDNVLIGGDINILRKKKNNINGEFISKYLTHIKKIEIAKYAQGITIIHLYSKDFKHLKIKLPSLHEQQKIAEVLSLADDEINLLKNELEELKQQKKALMQKLLTGETRVKV